MTSCKQGYETDRVIRRNEVQILTSHFSLSMTYAGCHVLRRYLHLSKQNITNRSLLEDLLFRKYDRQCLSASVTSG